MLRFTNEELADIHFIYGFCNGNGRRAELEYVNRFPNRLAPDHRTFERVHRNLREIGMFRHVSAERAGNIGYTADEENEILNIVRQDPTISTRRIAIRRGISQSKVWRTLNVNDMHPFHYTPVQELLPNDLIKRVNFCQQILNNDEHDPNYLASIFWTDESQFTRDGVVNFHNLHNWQQNNPHAKRPASFQTRFSVNVWCGIIGNILIGPTILPNRLNSDNYLHFLITNDPIVMDEVPVNVRDRVIYQQDGAPAHYGAQVRRWLNLNYRYRWIGRNGPIAWPPRSPDLTPLDFYVWGYMKSEVYAVEIQTREQLLIRIENAAIKIRENLLTFSMTDAIKKRFRACILQNGSHFENVV